MKRFEADTIQNKKHYSVFVSHSFKDSNLIKQIISILNKQGFSCYCDWLSDNDFLKRSLVSEYTKEVLKKRIEQSDKVLLVRTENSMTGVKLNSPWIELEIDHSISLKKPIYYIDLLGDRIKLPYTKLSQDIAAGIIDWSV